MGTRGRLRRVPYGLFVIAVFGTSVATTGLGGVFFESISEANRVGVRLSFEVLLCVSRFCVACSVVSNVSLATKSQKFEIRWDPQVPGEGVVDKNMRRFV